MAFKLREVRGRPVQAGLTGTEGDVVRKVPSRYKPGPTGELVADAVGAGLRTWFAKAAEEPAPQHLMIAIRRLESDEVGAGTRTTDPPKTA